MPAFDGIVKFGPLVENQYDPGMTIPIGASEVIKNQSGRFVKPDASQRAEIAGDGHTRLLGWLEVGAMLEAMTSWTGDTFTASSTEGASYGKLYRSTDILYRIPLRYDGSTYTVNYADTLIGKKYDLVVVSNVQYANITDQSEKTIIVWGGKAATSTTSNDGWVIVSMNPSKLGEAD